MSQPVVTDQDHEACDDPGCTHPIHLPDRDDVVWSVEDEDAAWLAEGDARVTP